MVNVKNQVLNRLLIISLHVVGWFTFVLLPFLFMGAPRGNRLRHPERTVEVEVGDAHYWIL